jgi:hypothetical protein
LAALPNDRAAAYQEWVDPRLSKPSIRETLVNGFSLKSKNSCGQGTHSFFLSASIWCLSRRRLCEDGFIRGRRFAHHPATARNKWQMNQRPVACLPTSRGIQLQFIRVYSRFVSGPCQSAFIHFAFPLRDFVALCEIIRVHPRFQFVICHLLISTVLLADSTRARCSLLWSKARPTALVQHNFPSHQNDKRTLAA